MANNQHFHVNRTMLTMGAALTGIGAVLSLTGTTIVAAALASAGRGWVREMDVPPAELAHRALHQAKVASTAGWEAWHTAQAAGHNGG